MRTSYIQIDGVLYEKGTEPRPQTPMVMPDIQPYQSMVTGEIIESRSKHREHLKRHGCVEIGNDIDRIYKKEMPDVAPQQRHELVRSQIAGMRHDEFKAMLKRDLDQIRWNSNNR
jgi:hypothetical protein